MRKEKPILVQKYGGTSVGDVERIKKVALRIKSYHQEGYPLVVVVSAMGDTTDRLLEMAYQVSSSPSPRELAVLLSTGEQISISLLAMALMEIGVEARSFTAPQLSIRTNQDFQEARIQSINTNKLLKALEEGKICIVAGFQGIDEEENITTLGRGGSDTTAVALAASLGAKECEIYTDVEGVFTADPSIVPTARKLDYISYEEMLELASLGAKVLHPRSVIFAKKYGVTLHVRSSFHYRPGTRVIKEEDLMEEPIVSGATLKKDEAQITLSKIPDRPGIAAEVFKTLADAGISVNMIAQSIGENQLNTISFTLERTKLEEAKILLEKLLDLWKEGEIHIDRDIAIVSVVGIGMRSHAGIAAKMFSALAQEGINIEMISTSEIKISCVVKGEKGEEALRAIHKVFDLGKKGIK